MIDERTRERYRFARILVATDGLPNAEGALRLAARLAQRDEARIEVVGVFAPRTPPMPGVSRAHPYETVELQRADVLFGRVRRQVAALLPAADRVHLHVGRPPWIIADVARTMKADLILLGHKPVAAGDARWNSRHTAQQVAFACDVPVLAVPHAMEALPHNAVVRGGSRATARATLIARALVGPEGAVHRATGEENTTLDRGEGMNAELVALPLLGDDFAVRSLLGGGIANVLEHAECMVLLIADGSPMPQRGATPPGHASLTSREAPPPSPDRVS